MGFNRHNSAISAKKQINRKNKLRVVFDENARKDFLTGFKKRKDERRKKAKEELEIKLKDEIKKIKIESKSKLEKAKVSKAHSIVPEISHLIHSDLADTEVQDFGTHSVSIVTLDSLEKASAPWRDVDGQEEGEEAEEAVEGVEDEELPGMSLKKKKSQPTGEREVTVSVVDPKERKNIARAALNSLQNTKAFKAKMRLKAKKQSQAARYSKGKQKSKRSKHHHPKKQ